MYYIPQGNPLAVSEAHSHTFLPRINPFYTYVTVSMIIICSWRPTLSWTTTTKAVYFAFAAREIQLVHAFETVNETLILHPI